MASENKVVFTKDMTLFLPDMVPIHFQIFEGLLKKIGYNVVLLNSTHQNVIEEGLKYIHNDMCYPALLVMGQYMEAIKSGKYDINKIALLISQTGGGCRASNYISLIRKALKRADMDHIPVISINFSGLEKDSAFSLTVSNYLEIFSALIYADLLMLLRNQIEPYEIKKGSANKKTDKWIKYFRGIKRIKFKKKLIKEILQDFEEIKIKKQDKPKVGIVGEIYVKYSPLGNNNLEQFLLKEGAEIVSPPLYDFVLYNVDAKITESRLYNRKNKTVLAYKVAYKLFTYIQRKVIRIIEKNSSFRPPCTFDYLKKVSKDVISNAVNMGEGWLLTAEMCEMAETGIDNIICTQPFGCLPNHIIAKGMAKKVKEKYHNANIVAIDYDPGASKTNQENRIKLMLQVAKDKKKKKR